MLIVELQCKEIIQVEQGYTNVTVNDSTPISQDSAANPDNVDTSDTGMTGTRTPTQEEEEKTRESILYGGLGTVIPGSSGG